MASTKCASDDDPSSVLCDDVRVEYCQSGNRNFSIVLCHSCRRLHCGYECSVSMESGTTGVQVQESCRNSVTWEEFFGMNCCFSSGFVYVSVRLTDKLVGLYCCYLEVHRLVFLLYESA